MEKNNLDWETTKKAIFSIAIGLVLVLISIIKHVAVNEITNKTVTVANGTKVNCTAVENDVLMQLINRFKIQSIETEGNCTKIIAYSENIQPFKRVDAVVVWCDRIYVVVTAQR
jgi:hypothetical protein